jgi:hypothetical protein
VTGWSADERNVVTFGRLYSNTLSPNRNFPPYDGPINVAASKPAWMSRCVEALSSCRQSRHSLVRRVSISTKGDAERG